MSKAIVAVRPTRDGRWEVVNSNEANEAMWRKAWDRWWKQYGAALQRKHPNWWREK